MFDQRVVFSFSTAVLFLCLGCSNDASMPYSEFVKIYPNLKIRENDQKNPGDLHIRGVDFLKRCGSDYIFIRSFEREHGRISAVNAALFTRGASVQIVNKVFEWTYTDIPNAQCLSPLESFETGGHCLLFFSCTTSAGMKHVFIRAGTVPVELKLQSPLDMRDTLSGLIAANEKIGWTPRYLVTAVGIECRLPVVSTDTTGLRLEYALKNDTLIITRFKRIRE